MRKVKEGALVVDVRNKNEVAEVTFDVPDYMNIPLGELEERINEIPKEKDIVMVSRSGTRSLKATYFLMNAGYENVSNMDGGILKWLQKGFPTIGEVQSADDVKSDGGCCGTETTTIGIDSISIADSSCCCDSTEGDNNSCC